MKHLLPLLLFISLTAGAQEQKTNCFGDYGKGSLSSIALGKGFSIDSCGYLVYNGTPILDENENPIHDSLIALPFTDPGPPMVLYHEDGVTEINNWGPGTVDENMKRDSIERIANHGISFRPLKEEDVTWFITKTYQEYRLISAARDIMELFDEYVASDFKDSTNTFTYWDWDRETKRFKGRPSYWIEPKPCFEGFIEYLRTK